MLRYSSFDGAEWTGARCCSRSQTRFDGGRAVTDASAYPHPADRSPLMIHHPQRLLQVPIAAATRRRPVVAKRDWAHVVDVNREIVNFRQLVPDMAKEVSTMSQHSCEMH